MRLVAIVPATSANLGPGFDCFGLALELCNEVTIDTDAEPGVAWEGEGADELPTDGSDRVSGSIRAMAERFQRTPPPMSIRGLNRIPLERGLGSSAASAVAGVAIADGLFDLGLDRTKILEIVAELEGHPDNAAAAVFGGFTVVVDDVLVARFDPHPELRPALYVPMGSTISTEGARRALPDTVAREVAVSNAGHAALTAIALMNEPALLPAAMRDRLHEEVRLGPVPHVREVYDRLRDSGLAVCVSGSGPTLLVFERDEVVTPQAGQGWRIVRVPVRLTGFELREG